MGWFFGYGSLVNHLTHDNRPLRAARLEGWRREWCLTTLRPVAFLSARPAPGSAIDGLVAQVPGGDWRALDQREYAYDRHPVTAQMTDERAEEAVQVYSVAGRHRAGTGRGSILLSYLDVVAEGYQHHFGEAGVAAFFATTDGWDRPVTDDRHQPVYPRHRPVIPAIRDMVDAELAARGIERRPPEG
ncbi:gamma-glutamylcyclotransferase family protein [Poseidonocella sp. HB161398]|uniref:gamma-glutamylcyclotransferase family protein n=1 Tax=Poseidonocella sp. HB161398 TaxID=2320855 RepID=UPI00110962BA|nr:gamma-glutamylcyclotransferase family protein [Poseidonocella sp. HB161398]